MQSRNPILIALALALSAMPAAAQPAAPPPDVPDTHIQTLHVTSREVVVDVIVTDANGQPVHGLQQSNFTIAENGHPQIIRSFKEFSFAAPVAEPAPPKLPLGVYTNSQSMPAYGPVNIILLDALHSNPADMIHTLQYTSDYLTALPPITRVAIFWLSESGLHLMQGFTSDSATLVRSLHSNRISVGSDQERHTTDWYTIDALNKIAAYVASIKGRKNLLWIVPGMPVNLMRDGGYAWQHPPDMGMVHRLMDVYERFTAEQIAVSPIDPRGVVGLGMGSLKVEAVAEDTGGEAFYNNNDLKSLLHQAVDNGSQFYTLSYIPPSQKDDGHYHTIKVEVDQPSLHLVYRKGYNAERVPTPDAPAPGPALMKASMEGAAPPATQVLFDIGVWPADPPALAPGQKVPKSKTVPYDIYFGFPASQIAFLDDPDGHLRGSLEFDIAAYDEYRKLVAHFTQTVPLSLAPDQFDDFIAKPYRFHQRIDLPLGPLSLHAGVLDNTSSKVGTTEISIVVAKPQPQRPGTPPPTTPTPCPPRCPLPATP